ncbi:MAG: FG-GAP repeat domain-containing protein [Thermoplasmatota archaeon]
MRKATVISALALLVLAGFATLYFGPSSGEKTDYIYDETGTAVKGGPLRITETGGVDSSYYFKVGRNVPISHAYFNISTHNSMQGEALQDPYIDIGIDGRNEWSYSGTGYGQFGEQHFFTDDSTKKSMNLPSGGGYNTQNKIMIPEGAEIAEASMEIMGRFIPESISAYTIMTDPSIVSLQGYAMESGDIDGDGYEDIVVSDTRYSRILWLKNPGNTSKNWGVYTVYSSSNVQNCYSLDLGDIDGDGDLDIAATSYSRYYVMYIRNNGQGSSWSVYIIRSSYYYAGRVRIADMDQDGNPDIVVLAYYLYYYYSYPFLYWFEAPDNPNTSSWTQHQIASAPSYYQYPYLAMDVGDINDDGYPDVAIGMYSLYYYYGNYNHVFWYKNPKTTTGSWTQYTVDSSAERAWTLDIGDIDDDGSLDIVTGAYDGNRVKLYRQTTSGWSEYNIATLTNPTYVRIADFNDDGKNDTLVGGGSGVFEFDVLIQGSSYTSWTKKTISQEVIDPMAFAPVDIEKDGDMDFMVVGRSGSQLVQIETLSVANYNFKLSWISDGGIKDIRDMDYADMDDDGDLDMVFISYGSGWLGWWENDGSPFNGVGKLHKLGVLGNGIKIMLADVDGDDDEDVVALSSGGVAAWFDNPGDPFVNWQGYILASGVSSAYSMYADDFTGDGKADVVISRYATSGAYIRIYKSPNNPRSDSWTWNYIATGLSYNKNIWADDMDLDGDMDVLAVYGNYANGVVLYYRNPTANGGNPMGGNWGSVSIAGSLYYPEDVKTIDITDDGYPDVITTGSYYYSQVRWYENPGGGGSWTQRSIYTGAYDWNIAVGDIGNDGYADVVFNYGSTSSPTSIRWYEEPEDLDQGWILHNIGSYSGTWGLGIADLDGDSISEILSTSRSLDEIRTYRVNAIFPQNVGFDIGADEANPDWSQTGELKGPRMIDFKDALQDVVDNLPSSVGRTTDNYGTGLLQIPVEIYSQTLGKIAISDIDIKYNVTIKIDQDGSGAPLARVLDRIIPDYADSSDPYMRIYIAVGADSGGMAYIDDLSVEYNAIPRQSKAIPDLYVDEDEKVTLPYDMKDYFKDDYTDPSDIHFRIKLLGPKREKIDAYIENDRIVLDSTLTPNFYTRSSEPYEITAIIVVTDTGGPNNVPARSFQTKEIPVFVEPVNDPPTRTTDDLPVLHAWEGQTTIVADLDDYDLFDDVDGDALQLRLVPDLEVEGYDPNAGFDIKWITRDNTISVSLKETSDWTGTIPVRMYATDESEWNYNQNPNVDFLVEVLNINDGPSWNTIPRVFAMEDTPDTKIIELSQYAVDHDTPRSELSITIDSWTNMSFVTVKAVRTQDKSTYISFDPKSENWIGSSTVQVTLSDGEYSAKTSFIIEVQPVNDLPSIRIIEPVENGRIEPGFFSVVGESSDIEGVQRVDVYYNGEWFKADGTNNWGYTFTAVGAEKIQEGIMIMVRVFDGEEYSYDYVNITILPEIIPPNPDYDGDGIPNNLDDFEWDPSETKDSDKDGVGDNSDPFPFDPQWKSDKDGDGIADEADNYPDDPENRPPIETMDRGGKDEGYDLTVPILLILITAALLAVMIISIFAFVKKRAVTRDPRRMAAYYAKQQRWREKRHEFIENLPLARIMDKLSGSGGKPVPSNLPSPGRPGGPSPSVIRPNFRAPPLQGTTVQMPTRALPPIQRQPPNRNV